MALMKHVVHADDRVGHVRTVMPVVSPLATASNCWITGMKTVAEASMTK